MLRSEVETALRGWHLVVDLVAKSCFRVSDQDPKRGDVEIEWWDNTDKVFTRRWLSATEFRELLYREANAQAKGKHAGLPARLTRAS